MLGMALLGLLGISSSQHILSASQQLDDALRNVPCCNQTTKISAKGSSLVLKGSVDLNGDVEIEGSSEEHGELWLEGSINLGGHTLTLRHVTLHVTSISPTTPTHVALAPILSTLPGSLLSLHHVTLQVPFTSFEALLLDARVADVSNAFADVDSVSIPFGRLRFSSLAYPTLGGSNVTVVVADVRQVGSISISTGIVSSDASVVGKFGSGVDVSTDVDDAGGGDNLQRMLHDVSTASLVRRGSSAAKSENSVDGRSTNRAIDSATGQSKQSQVPPAQEATPHLLTPEIKKSELVSSESEAPEHSSDDLDTQVRIGVDTKLHSTVLHVHRQVDFFLALALWSHIPNVAELRLHVDINDVSYWSRLSGVALTRSIRVKGEGAFAAGTPAVWQKEVEEKLMMVDRSNDGARGTSCGRSDSGGVDNGYAKIMVGNSSTSSGNNDGLEKDRSSNGSSRNGCGSRSGSSKSESTAANSSSGLDGKILKSSMGKIGWPQAQQNGSMGKTSLIQEPQSSGSGSGSSGSSSTSASASNSSSNTGSSRIDSSKSSRSVGSSHDASNSSSSHIGNSSSSGDRHSAGSNSGSNSKNFTSSSSSSSSSSTSSSARSSTSSESIRSSRSSSSSNSSSRIGSRIRSSSSSSSISNSSISAANVGHHGSADTTQTTPPVVNFGGQVGVLTLHDDVILKFEGVHLKGLDQVAGLKVRGSCSVVAGTAIGIAPVGYQRCCAAGSSAPLLPSQVHVSHSTLHVPCPDLVLLATWLMPLNASQSLPADSLAAFKRSTNLTVIPFWMYESQGQDASRGPDGAGAVSLSGREPSRRVGEFPASEGLTAKPAADVAFRQSGSLGDSDGQGNGVPGWLQGYGGVASDVVSDVSSDQYLGDYSGNGVDHLAAERRVPSNRTGQHVSHPEVYPLGSGIQLAQLTGPGLHLKHVHLVCDYPWGGPKQRSSKRVGRNARGWQQQLQQLQWQQQQQWQQYHQQQIPNPIGDERTQKLYQQKASQSWYQLLRWWWQGLQTQPPASDQQFLQKLLRWPQPHGGASEGYAESGQYRESSTEADNLERYVGGGGLMQDATRLAQGCALPGNGGAALGAIGATFARVAEQPRRSDTRVFTWQAALLGLCSVLMAAAIVATAARARVQGVQGVHDSVHQEPGRGYQFGMAGNTRRSAPISRRQNQNILSVSPPPQPQYMQGDISNQPLLRLIGMSSARFADPEAVTAVWQQILDMTGRIDDRQLAVHDVASEAPGVTTWCGTWRGMPVAVRKVCLASGEAPDSGVTNDRFCARGQDTNPNCRTAGRQGSNESSFRAAVADAAARAVKEAAITSYLVHPHVLSTLSYEISYESAVQKPAPSDQYARGEPQSTRSPPERLLSQLRWESSGALASSQQEATSSAAALPTSQHRSTRGSLQSSQPEPTHPSVSSIKQHPTKRGVADAQLRQASGMHPQQQPEGNGGAGGQNGRGSAKWGWLGRRRGSTGEKKRGTGHMWEGSPDVRNAWNYQQCPLESDGKYSVHGAGGSGLGYEQPVDGQEQQEPKNSFRCRKQGGHVQNVGQMGVAEQQKQYGSKLRAEYEEKQPDGSLLASHAQNRGMVGPGFKRGQGKAEGGQKLSPAAAKQIPTQPSRAYFDHPNQRTKSIPTDSRQLSTVSGEAGGTTCSLLVVSEVCTHGRLDTWLSSPHAMWPPPGEPDAVALSLKFGLQLASAISYTLSRGFVHGNISAEAIFIASVPEDPLRPSPSPYSSEEVAMKLSLKLGCFGASEQLPSGVGAVTQSLPPWGGWSPPEAIAARRIGPATDVYGLGGVLWEMIVASLGQGGFGMSVGGMGGTETRFQEVGGGYMMDRGGIGEGVEDRIVRWRSQTTKSIPQLANSKQSRIGVGEGYEGQPLNGNQDLQRTSVQRAQQLRSKMLASPIHRESPLPSLHGFRKVPTSCPLIVAALVAACLESNPGKRPGIHSVEGLLRAVNAEIEGVLGGTEELQAQANSVLAELRGGGSGGVVAGLPIGQWEGARSWGLPEVVGRWRVGELYYFD